METPLMNPSLMSTSSLSDFPHPLDNPESDDTVPRISPNPETRPIQQNPENKNDQEEEITVISLSENILPQPVTGSKLTMRNPHRCFGPNKRKKGKGKGKPNLKKLQIFQKKLQSLLDNLNPIPFKPHKRLEFSKHEELFRKLGLWDFVNVDFDKNVRKDLLVQLVASYESRCSYVNGHRIGVTRPDLARSFKIPLKKDKDCIDSVSFSEDSIAFIGEFVSEWVLLHDDMWMMPDEVMNWIKMVKDGHPEKVDWAGMIWFMVEKELAQGENLMKCYYASHLQHLMKEQKVFSREEAEGILVSIDEETEEVDRVDDGNEKVGVGPSVELTLGHDKEKEEGKKECEIMDLDDLKEKNNEIEVNEPHQWLPYAKNVGGVHSFQGCGSENGRELGLHSMFETDEMEFEANREAGDKLNVFANDTVVRGGLTGNFLQSMEANQITFSSGLSDMQQTGSGPSILNGSGKRAIEHDDSVIFSHSLNESNKRLRITGSTEQKPSDFVMCLDNAQKIMQQARIFYQEKENATEELNAHNQILINELQKRDDIIEMLQKSIYEEVQKKDNDIYRYERELILMGNALDGYRNALRDTKRAFDEYRKKAQLLEELAYKDVGGGLILSTGEIEFIHKKNEEELQTKYLIVEQRLKEEENDCFAKLDAFLEKINVLDKKLRVLEADVKELRGLVAKRKVSQTCEKVPDVAELSVNEEVAEVNGDLNPAVEDDNCQ